MTEPRRFPRATWWLLGAFVVLVVAAAFWANSRFERDLAADATDALLAQGLEVTVVFDGRDALLSGTVGSTVDVDRAVLIVKELTGVRDVDASALSVVSTTSPTTTTSTLAPEQFPAVVEIAIGESGVTLAGLVSAAPRDALVAAAEASFGVDAVTDNLQVNDAVATPEWLLVLPDAFAEFGVVEQANIVVGDQGLEIAGIVSRADAVETVGIRLAQITRLQVTNQLAYTALPTPSLSAQASGSTVVLAGELPTQADIDAIFAAASTWYASVDNQLTLAEVSSAEWIGLIPGLIDTLGTWPAWTARIDVDGATLGGFAPSSDVLEGISFGPLLPFDLDWDLDALEVDPAALADELTKAIAGLITFSSGSAVLSPDSTVVLDEVVQALLRNPSARLQVRGHTDDVGAAASNQLLSEQRAQAVVNYLVSGGIDPSRLTAIGLGEDEPIASNSTASGRAQNRRIEFVVKEEGGG